MRCVVGFSGWPITEHNIAFTLARCRLGEKPLYCG